MTPPIDGVREVPEIGVPASIKVAQSLPYLHGALGGLSGSTITGRFELSLKAFVAGRERHRPGFLYRRSVRI